MWIKQAGLTVVVAGGSLVAVYAATPAITSRRTKASVMASPNMCCSPNHISQLPHGDEESAGHQSAATKDVEPGAAG